MGTKTGALPLAFRLREGFFILSLRQKQYPEIKTNIG
jgi:hypothetical protein